MADKKENTETEEKADAGSKAKPKSKSKAAAKEKAKPKAKAKAKAKPKAETKAKSTSKAKDAEPAPYIKMELKAESSKKGTSTTKFFMVIFAALILLTVYQYNEEHSDSPALTETQNIAAQETLEAAVPAGPADTNTVTQSSDTPVAPVPAQSAYETTREQSRLDVQERAAKHEEMMQQRRRDFETEIQIRQKKYNELLAAREQERAKIAEIQQQIYELHEEIHRLIQESRKRRSPL